MKNYWLISARILSCGFIGAATCAFLSGMICFLQLAEEMMNKKNPGEYFAIVFAGFLIGALLGALVGLIVGIGNLNIIAGGGLGLTLILLLAAADYYSGPPGVFLRPMLNTFLIPTTLSGILASLFKLLVFKIIFQDALSR